MSLVPDELAWHVLACFGVVPVEVRALGNHGGFSGAQLWRVRTAVGDWCLKAWPAGVTVADHLRNMHDVMRFSRNQGLPYVPMPYPQPAGDTWVEVDGRHWDLVTWMPGRADFRARPTANRLRNACVALARFHRLWKSPPPFQPVYGPCHAVTIRLLACLEWCEMVRSGWRPAAEVRADDPVAPWVERALRAVIGRIPQTMPRLANYRLRPVERLFCLGDAWHDHVLFEGDVVSGIVDFGGLKIECASVDLARMLGSFVGDDAQAQFDGLAAYDTIRPLSSLERQLVPLLDQTGVLLGIANWLRWLYHERRQYEDRIVVAQRLGELVQRVERWH
jgi:homoserine kinase type II